MLAQLRYKIIDQYNRNTNDSNISPPVVTMAALCNIEEDTTPQQAVKRRIVSAKIVECSMRGSYILVSRRKVTMAIIEKKRSVGLEELSRFQIIIRTWNITSSNIIV